MAMATSRKSSTPRAILRALIFLSEILAAAGARNVGDGEGALKKIDEPPSLRFVAIGDWGAPLASPSQRSGQQAVADGIASWLEELSRENENVEDETAPFILSLGDNFYPSGVKDIDDMERRFSESFDDIYSHDSFDDVPWYVVAGNKDHEGDVSAQMQFSGSSRWIFPDYFHRVIREFKVQGGDVDEGTVKVEILAIDTMKLAESPNISHEIMSNVDKRLLHEATDPGLWIQYHLSHSDADYLIVAGHFPAHMVPGLEDLLQTHDVSAYVSGHIHCQKHARKNEVDMFTTGAGMELDCNEDTIDREDASGGFISFDAKVDKMVVTFHDQSGDEIHSTEISPRFNDDPWGMLEDSIEIE